jgi:hypothetical protein
MRGLGQHTLLGIVVGYARFWATHITGHHLLNNSRKVGSVSFRISSETAEVNIPSQTKSHGTAFLFPN